MKNSIKYIYLVICLLCTTTIRSQHSSIFSDSIKSVELQLIGIKLSNQGQFIKSNEYYYESLAIRKKIYGEQSQKLSIIYTNLGVNYKNLGQLNNALKFYFLAEKNYRPDQKYKLYSNIGSVYRSKLNYVNALQYYEKALESAIKANLPLEDITTINYNIAEINFVIKQDDKALAIAKRNIDQPIYVEDKILLYELLASIYQVKKEFKQAKANYQKAIDLTEKAYKGVNEINIAIAYLNYSVFLVSINQYDNAEDALNKAYEIIQKTKPVNNQVLSDYYKFKGYFANNKAVETTEIESFKKQKRKNLNEAIDWYKKGLITLNFPVTATSESDLLNHEIISLTDCIILLKQIGDVYSELSDIDRLNENPVLSESLGNAIKTYQFVGSLIQKSRKELSDDASKLQLSELLNSTFYKIINSSNKAYEITGEKKYLEIAFQNAEQLKSTSVFDKISDQLAAENSLIPDSIIELERKYNSIISFYNDKLFEEKGNSNPSDSLIGFYNSQIFEATRKREDLSQFMESEYKDYYDLKYSNSTQSLFEIQQKLKEDQVILNYVLNDNDSINELYTFVIRKSKVNLIKQVIDNKLNTEIQTIFNFLSNSEFMFTKNIDSKNYCLSAYNLYSLLIKPFQEEIINKKVIIIPDGKLSYIPLDALIFELPDTLKPIEFNNLNYLIRKYSFNYANSANLYFKQLNTRKKHNIKVIAFAPDYKNGDTINYGNQKLALLPLKGIQKEVTQIEKIVNTTVLTGNEASEENFRKMAGKFDILHLSMHAFVNDSLPAFSSFAFTQTKSEDPLSNGLLNTMDIYNLKLNARMTVLSACNTGTGQLKKGEGIMSLARGFLYAGCPSIIMSLWEVEDESGTKIMTSFYKNLKRGKSKDEALRSAKLEYLNSVNSRLAHPHYWLGFVSLGDNSSLFISYDYYFFVILILAFVGIGIDQAIRIKKARQRRAS